MKTLQPKVAWAVCFCKLWRLTWPVTYKYVCMSYGDLNSQVVWSVAYMHEIWRLIAQSGLACKLYVCMSYGELQLKVAWPVNYMFV